MVLEGASPHREAARIVSDVLIRTFPNSGIAVAGSVAAGTFTPRSDLDLLVVDPDFAHEMHFGFWFGGIPVSLLCLRPHLTARRQSDVMFAPGIESITSYVLRARALHDPCNHLAALQAEIEAVQHASLSRREERSTFYARVTAELLENARGIRQRAHMVHMVPMLLAWWCVLNGVSRDTKAQANALFDTIEQTDPSFYSLLRDAIPVVPASLAALTDARAHLLAVHADGI